MKMLSIRLPEPLAEWVQTAARKSGRTQSEVIREALEQRRATGKAKSVGEMMEQFGGTFKGPRDLSTNKKHFEGFGR